MTNDAPIVVEQGFNVSISSLWSAISQLDEMQPWYFPMLQSFEAKVGFETRFTIENEGRVFPHIWKVTLVEDQKRLDYEWTFEGYNGKGISSFELEGDGNSSTLKLSSTNVDDFPDDIPEFKRESGLAGWNFLIKEQLYNYLKT